MPIIEGSRMRVPFLTAAGAPTVNVTGLGVARVGDCYQDATSGSLYICTATNKTSTITWALVATQV
jgi:uncharacterized Zn-binding protein involved in type VI secretion